MNDPKQPSVGLINQQPRPRMLLLGTWWNFDSHAPMAEALAALVPTSRHVFHIEDVRADEWDFVITLGGLFEYGLSGGRAIPRHLSAIVFASVPKDNKEVILDVSDGAPPQGVVAQQGYRGSELCRVSNVPEDIADLLRERLEPVLVQRTSHLFFVCEPRAALGRVIRTSTGETLELDPSPVAPDTYELEPFVWTPNGTVLAGRYRRSANAEAWLLPADVGDPVPWVKAALGEWHKLNPERFPGIPGWSTHADWRTPAENKIAAELQTMREQREIAIAEFDAQESELLKLQDAASSAADGYERALLTEQSGSLVDAVLQALRELGFIVTDSDLAVTPGQRRLQDLIIEDPARPHWTVLAEVKGFVKGAKTSALFQFIDFKARYVVSQGREPDGLWYVVNQFRTRDPSTRPPVLRNQDEDAEAFAQQHGLVIDTVDLFRLLIQVRRNEIRADDARHRLRTQTGVFAAHAPSPPESESR